MVSLERRCVGRSGEAWTSYDARREVLDEASGTRLLSPPHQAGPVSAPALDVAVTRVARRWCARGFSVDRRPARCAAAVSNRLRRSN